jgi:hypothetical protein
MLTGNLPVDGTTSEILRQRLVADPQPPSREVHDLDPRLDAVCMTAMARDPAQRFASMQGFAGSLAQVLGEGPSDTALGPRLPAELPLRTGRRRTVLALVAVAALAWVLIGLAYYWYNGGRSGAFNEPAPLPAGSVWSGEFRFIPLGTKDGDLTVRITTRDGDRFEGNYATEAGQYEWRIAGTLQGSKIHWEFTEAVRGDGAAGLVGKGTVDGTLKDNTIEGEFHDSSDNTHATLKVARQ